MKKTLLLLSAFVASLVTFAQTNLTSGKEVHPLGGLKSYQYNEGNTTVNINDLQKITKDGNTDNVFLFPENNYTDDNKAIGIQGFYIELKESKVIGLIKTTWEGAAAGGEIYVTDSEPALGNDGKLTNGTLIGSFEVSENAVITAKDVEITSEQTGKYVVFVPTTACNYGWGVKIHTFAAYANEASVLTSFEVFPAFVMADMATEMTFVAKNQGGFEMTEGISYTVSNNAKLEDNKLTANGNAGEVVVTATYNGVSLSKNIIVINGVPEEPTADAANVLAVYSPKYGREELKEATDGWGGYPGELGKLFESIQYDELTAEGGAKHKVAHVKGTGINGRICDSEGMNTDATGYNKFHAAIYPMTATSAVIFKDNGYADRVSVTGLTPGQWNYIEKTVDFDSNYVTIALDGETEFYVDHIYFEKIENADKVGSFTIAAACTDGEKYYSTFYAKDTDYEAYVMPEGVEGQVVSVKDNQLVVTTAYIAGEVVPAQTPLLLCASKPGAYTYIVSNEEGVKPTSENMLHCGDEVGWEEAGVPYLYYRLTMHNGTELGFWWGAENGGYFGAIAATKNAYLAVPQTATAALVRGFGFDGEATAISNVKAEAAGEDVIYDLSGRRVLAPVKAGIYIVNGKKMVIK